MASVYPGVYAHPPPSSYYLAADYNNAVVQQSPSGLDESSPATLDAWADVHVAQKSHWSHMAQERSFSTPSANTLDSVQSSTGSTPRSPPAQQEFERAAHYTNTWFHPQPLMDASAALPDPAFDMASAFPPTFDYESLLDSDQLSGFAGPAYMETLYSPSSLGGMFENGSSRFASHQHSISPMPSQAHQHSDQRASQPHHTLSPSAQPQSPLSRDKPTSFTSHTSPASIEIDDDGKEKARCPYPDCAKLFKDLKAHMLTHQMERPEKCPITSCEFHKKGFARKYDRNRHLVTTHYKATMVCGFCPGVGSSSEKSFNRTDVFKRHLVSIHKVEQSVPNSKKKSPGPPQRQMSASANPGKCSTCGFLFGTPQELFDHLDDCVLRVLQHVDPIEEFNERHLRSVADDRGVHETMERNMIPLDASLQTSNGFEHDDDDYDDYDDDDEADNVDGSRTDRSGRGSIKSKKDKKHGLNLHTTNSALSKTSVVGPRKRGGITYSEKGVTLTVGKRRRRGKHYPPNWGCSADKMKMKKRVLCVFDGERRLWKDDMMLANDFEVRMQLPDSSNAYITDLDVETLKRAEAFHMATEEERGPWQKTNFPLPNVGGA